MHSLLALRICGHTQGGIRISYDKDDSDEKRKEKEEKKAKEAALSMCVQYFCKICGTFVYVYVCGCCMYVWR